MTTLRFIFTDNSLKMSIQKLVKSRQNDRNLRNSLVRSSPPSNLEPGTFNCSRIRCNTCPFINSKAHVQGPKGSYLVNDHFDCTAAKIICSITCTLCSKLYIVESGHKLGDHFREHLLDVKNKDSDLSKPVARYFNLRRHSHELTRKFTNQFTPRKQ